MKLKRWKFVVFFGFALAGLGASASTGALAASPTPDDIYQAARAGNLGQAQQMVQQVIAAHPKSAKAHYIAAEIYAKEGQLAAARKELQTAEQLKPGLPFVQPQAVARLTAMLSPHPGAQTRHMHRGSIPFGPLVLVMLAIGVVIVVIKISAARAANRAYQAGANPPSPTGAAGPGTYPPGAYPPAGGGMGSGIVGGLATGAAVGAGMVAGEALAHHFLDGDKAAGNAVQSAQFAQNDDMGGNDFGLNDGGGWDDGGDTFADFSGDGDWS